MQCLARLVKRLERSEAFVAASLARHSFPLLETCRDSWHAVCHGKQRPTRARSKKAQEENSEACSSQPLHAHCLDAHRLNPSYSPKESPKLSISRLPHRPITPQIRRAANLPKSLQGRGLFTQSFEGPLPPFVLPFFQVAAPTSASSPAAPGNFVLRRQIAALSIHPYSAAYA
jgi:hypothetical protein